MSDSSPILALSSATTSAPTKKKISGTFWLLNTIEMCERLALRYLAEHTPFGAEKNWDGSVATLEQTLGVHRPDAMIKLQEVTGLDSASATRLLWETYSPQLYVWLPFAAIGVLSALSLFIFARIAHRWSDMNA